MSTLRSRPEHSLAAGWVRSRIQPRNGQAEGPVTRAAPPPQTRLSFWVCRTHAPLLSTEPAPGPRALPVDRAVRGAAFPPRRRPLAERGRCCLTPGLWGSRLPSSPRMRGWDMLWSHLDFLTAPSLTGPASGPCHVLCSGHQRVPAVCGTLLRVARPTSLGWPRTDRARVCVVQVLGARVGGWGHRELTASTLHAGLCLKTAPGSRGKLGPSPMG